MKISKSLILAAAAAMCFPSARAGILSPEQAWSRAEAAASRGASTLGLLPEKTAPRLVHTAAQTSGQPAVYIFANPDLRGFHVVSASDAAVPVLGYSADGTIDPANLPPALEAWLADYAAQIAAAEQCGGRVVAAAPIEGLSSVSPVMKTLWNQDSPYNDLCPEVDGTRTPSGCVATAAAQVIRTYQYPETGTGTFSYDWSGGKTLTFDFGNTTFDWANMTDTYGASSTKAERSAVATLMYAIGVASQMNYTVAGSGTSTINLCNGLVRNFGFGKSLCYKQRNYYTLETWTRMLHEELAAGYPVYYEGSGTGSHAFVIDGYEASSGLFHVNWGWGGSSNGYFRITNLEPSSQGIGGSNAGYSNSQMGLFGLRKATADSDWVPYLVLSGNLAPRKTTYARNETVELLGGDTGSGVFCYSVTTLPVEFGLRLTDDAGKTSMVWSTWGTTEFVPYNGFIRMDYKASSFPARGTYTAEMVCSYGGKIYPIPAPLGYASTMKVTCESTGVTLVPIEESYEMTATEPVFSTSVYLNKSTVATSTVTNSGAEYFGEIKLGFLKTSTYKSAEDIVAIFENTASIDLTKGESAEVNLRGKVSGIEAGQYYAGVFDRNKTLISSLKAVTVKEEPTAEAAVQMAGRTFPDAVGGNGTSANPFLLPHGRINFELKLRCTRGYFDDGVSAWVYNPGVDNPIVGINATYTPFESGQVGVLSFAGDLSQLETDHTYALLIYNSTRGSWINSSGIYVNFFEPEPDALPSIEAAGSATTLTIGPNPATDVAEISASGAEIATVTVYSLTGAQVLAATPNSATARLSVASLPSGHYIVRATTASGLSLSGRLIKR